MVSKKSRTIRSQELSYQGPMRGFYWQSLYKTAYAQAILYGIDLECPKSDLPVHTRFPPVQEWYVGNDFNE